MFEQEHPYGSKAYMSLNPSLVVTKKEIHEGVDMWLIPEQIHSFILSPKVSYRACTELGVFP